MPTAKARLGKNDEIIIPSNIYTVLGVAEGDLVEIELIDGNLVIRPAKLPIKMRNSMDHDGDSKPETS